jgi:hypothetical protein
MGLGEFPPCMHIAWINSILCVQWTFSRLAPILAHTQYIYVRRLMYTPKKGYNVCQWSCRMLLNWCCRTLLIINIVAYKKIHTNHEIIQFQKHLSKLKPLMLQGWNLVHKELCSNNKEPTQNKDFSYSHITNCKEAMTLTIDLQLLIQNCSLATHTNPNLTITTTQWGEESS